MPGAGALTTLPLFDAPPAGAEPTGASPEGEPQLTPEQAQAVARPEPSVLVHAGAGSGKTRVLVERYARAVLAYGVAPERILAITFTEKAAAELRGRIRERLLVAGDREGARALDSAWISTIHGFCSRALRAHALEVGLDPDYRVLDEHRARDLADAAFEAALDEFVGHPPDRCRAELLADYGTRRVEEAVRSVHARLRGRGVGRPRLPHPDAPSEADVEHAYARLRSVTAEAREALRAGGASGARVVAALAVLERCERACREREPGGALDPFELRELAVNRGNARALRLEALDHLDRVHAECLAACAATRAARDLPLLDELLERYGRRYEALKAERSGLDFDDLEIRTLELLRSRPSLRDRLRGRFELVLVDELQDTNRPQSEILDLVAPDTLFAVGDEQQAIYGFRGADVGVFRERRAAASASGAALHLARTFRMPRPLADALNAAFAPVFGTPFLPLEAAEEGPSPPARGGDEAARARVELIAVDRSSPESEEVREDGAPRLRPGAQATPTWRAAEAHALAARIGELIAHGEFEVGEVAVLLRSWSDVTLFERAIVERGIPTHVRGGGGLWADPAIADLRAYLGIVANPLDEEALVSALASPLVGASLDAIALLGLRARRLGGLWPAVVAAVGVGAGAEGGAGSELRAELADADRDRLARFGRRLAGERRTAGRISLRALLEQIVADSGYDRALLALPGGERRLANVRKLERLAAEHEEEAGPELRGFLDALDARVASDGREGEAPVAAEGADAVRLMTVHAAKGLEFPLVCVADLGRRDPPSAPVLRAEPDGRVGVRLPDPAGRGGLDTLAARELAEEERRAGDEEERRLLWVAATRAQRCLIVSGALDVGRRCDDAPLDWLGPALVPELHEAVSTGRQAGLARRKWRGREALVAWRVVSPGTTRALASGSCTPVEVASSRGRGKQPEERLVADVAADYARTRPEPLDAGAPSLDPPFRISYSALEAHRRCGYRFHLEREVGLPPNDDDPALLRAGTDGTPGPARTRGTVVHELLEGIDFARPVAPDPSAVTARLQDHGVAADAAAVRDIRSLVGGFLTSPLCARMARAGRVRKELPFAFTLPIAPAPGARGEPHELLVEGVLDALCDEDGGALVVDYKTDRIEDGWDLGLICEREYGPQRLVYALAALRSRAERVEVVHAFLERPDEPVSVAYAADDEDELEVRLAELAGSLVAGHRAPSDAPGAEVCAGCPARSGLCIWPAERTGAPRSEAPLEGSANVAVPSAA